MRRKPLKNRSNLALIAAGLLALPLGFVLINILQYELGIPVPWNAYGSVYDQISGTNWTQLFDVVILFSPIVAVLIVSDRSREAGLSQAGLG